MADGSVMAIGKISTQDRSRYLIGSCRQTRNILVVEEDGSSQAREYGDVPPATKGQ